jgi:hypothetical protein
MGPKVSVLPKYRRNMVADIALGTCHAGGRAILQQKKEYILNNDIGPDSVYYQYTSVS